MNNWIYFLFFCLISVHVRSIVHSLYLHRGIAHGMFTFSKSMHHVCRFILFINTIWWPHWNKHYTAQHRKHHKYSDTPDDPHSPHHYGFFQMLDYRHSEPGRPYYISNDEIINFTPDIHVIDDWMEKNIYAKLSGYGIIVQYILIWFLFDPLIFLVSIPVLYLLSTDIYVIVGNWVFHNIGYNYRDNINTVDRATNLMPIGLCFAGEELHANHHNFPRRPNFAIKWYEFDLGYWYARFFILLGFMKTVEPNHKGHDHAS